MQLFNFFNLTTWQVVWIVIAAVFIGFSKTGISGFSMVSVPIIASIFGGKESTGIILPMLLIGDVFAVYYYNRHANWNNVIKPLPWAIFGLLLGSFVGNYINDKQFKILIAISVFICLGILQYTEKKGDKFKVPNGSWFYLLTGIASGFTSMIGNAAGPVFTMYLLAMGFKKNDFLGTNSWFFLIINLIKVPLQVFMWHNISLQTCSFALIMIPAITFGAFLGIITIKKLNEKFFRKLSMLMTALAGIKLFF